MGKLHARLYKTDRARDFDHEQVTTYGVPRLLMSNMVCKMANSLVI